MSFGVFVNGSLEGFFKISHGLKQGDLLSPLLFIMVIEMLGNLVQKLIAYGFFFGFWVGLDGILLAWILFVDDSLLFIDLNPENFHTLRCLLWFEETFKLKINLKKRKVMAVSQVSFLAELQNYGLRDSRASFFVSWSAPQGKAQACKDLGAYL